MALQKSITLPNGATGNYIRVGDTVEIHRRLKRAEAHVTLFLNEAQANANPDYGLGVIGLLNLQGDKFDLYLGKDALTRTYGGDISRALYAAAKTEVIRPTPLGLQVQPLKDAVDA